MNEKDRRQLEAFIKPKSVAVVGASDRFGSWGSFIMKGLLSYDFPGKIFPVNRNAGTISGIKAYPDILSIPDEVELVVLAIPAESVYETINACVRKCVRGITIITSGFGEALEEGKEQEKELTRLARAHGIRLLGPNVSGTFNLHDNFNAAPSPVRFLVPSPVTAICQGGYAIYDLIASSYWRGMGVGQFIHTGNECDLKVTDFLDYFGEDPRTKAILMYLETIRDVSRFRDVASRVAKKKPVIVYKAGRTPAGFRAARSHTGALSSDYAIYSAFFHQLNIVSSPRIELLIPLAYACLEFPPMHGNRVAIITMGGSWGVAISDALEDRGLIVPELSPALQKRIREVGMPIRASTRNPVDIGAAGALAYSAEAVADMADRILNSGEVDALILHGLGRPGMITERSHPDTKRLIDMEKNVMRACSRLMKKCGKPVLLGSNFLSTQSQAVHDIIQEGHRVFHRADELADILSLIRVNRNR